MNILKLICLTIVQLVKQALTLPHMVSLAVKERRQQGVRNVLEAERLDRIRDPEKYRGK